jgi:hypothetical protein
VPRRPLLRREVLSQVPRTSCSKRSTNTSFPIFQAGLRNHRIANTPCGRSWGVVSCLAGQLVGWPFPLCYNTPLGEFDAEVRR